MFDLRRPCVSCPFRKGQGELFQLTKERLEMIQHASAFQCHKTVDYDGDGKSNAGDRPQQCAGLMSVLERENKRNQITQVAVRLANFDPSALDPLRETYESWFEVLKAHRCIKSR
jgi:hypothetical protein